MKVGHIGLLVNDLQKSKVFYDAIIQHLGLESIDESQTSVRYGNDGKAQLYIHTRNEPVKGIHLCFEVETKEQVDAFYETALRSGGMDHGAPNIREEYSPMYYAAYALDPDRNNIEALCRNHKSSI